MTTWKSRMGLAFGGALLVALGAAPAGADDTCASECQEARSTCRRAAHAAWRACAAECGESVAAAARAARRVCDEGELGPIECRRLVREAVQAAQSACREDCGNARALARRLCSEERADCRRTCVAGLDPSCVAGCRDELATCREGLDACTEGCRPTLDAALAACRTEAAAGGTCDPEVYRECAAAARADALVCGAGCHEEHPCGGELRECLAACPAADPEPGSE